MKMNEDVFRKIMAHAREIPQIVYIARCSRYDDSDMVIGYFDTAEKADAAIQASASDAYFDYMVLTVNLERLGHDPYYHFDNNPVVCTTKVALSEDLEEKALWSIPIEDLRGRFRSAYGSDREYLQKVLHIREAQAELSK